MVYESKKLKIIAGQTSRVDDMTAVRKALHEQIEVKCFYAGSATLLVGTQTVSVKAGDVVVINPYEFHATVDRGPKDDEGKYHLLMIPLDYFADRNMSELDLRGLFMSKKEAFRTLFSGKTELTELLHRAVRESTEMKEAYNAVIFGILAEFFGWLLRYGLRGDHSYMLNLGAQHAYQLVDPALRHIRDHYSDTIQVEQLANLCGISKHYFCRTFQSVTGKPPMEYLQEYRLVVAETLLRNSGKNISQISEQCGFGSANYFSRCYKKHFGVAPSAITRRDQI